MEVKCISSLEASKLDLRFPGSKMAILPKSTVLVSGKHRRRMETEAKAKVVTSVWGENFVQFLATLAVLPWTILNKRINSSYSSFAFVSVSILLISWEEKEIENKKHLLKDTLKKFLLARLTI